MPATGLRRRRTFQVWRDDLRVVPKDFSSDGTPVPPAPKARALPRTVVAGVPPAKDLGIAAGTAASTSKIKHRTSVRVHWFIL